jgi:cytochrome c oxidase subunit 4
MQDSRPARQPQASGAPYVAAWAVLLLLTAASFGIDHLALGRLTLPATLTIAGIKAALVLWVFMHLRREPFAIRFIAILNVGWVLMICAGIAADVAAR